MLNRQHIGILDEQLQLAQESREDEILSDELDLRLDVLLSHSDVSPDARAHLREILKHYAKNPHPFRACVRDNMKRFGPGQTEKVCATVKDMIKGTHKWRNSGGGALAAASPEITDELEQILLSIDEDALDSIVMEASYARS